jgi:hypothetical protein
MTSEGARRGYLEAGRGASKVERSENPRRKIEENLRLENFSSLILMGLARNFNSRFAIRFCYSAESQIIEMRIFRLF